MNILAYNPRPGHVAPEIGPFARIQPSVRWPVGWHHFPSPEGIRIVLEMARLARHGLVLPQDEIAFINSHRTTWWFHSPTGGERFWWPRQLIESSPVPFKEVPMCDICGAEVDSLVENGDQHVCQSCYDAMDVCPHCGLRHDGENASDVRTGRNGRHQRWCSDCVDDAVSECDDCGDLYDQDLLSDGLCDSCLDDYGECDACGSRTHNDCLRGVNGAYVCESCYDERQRGGIREHGYKPTPMFHAMPHEDRPLFLGIELEVDRSEDAYAGETARKVVEHLGHDHVYVKSDGSLDNGFEIVTHPHTLEWLKSRREWFTKGMIDISKDDGWKSHDAGSCGLHVHVNRSFLNEGDGLEVNLIKLLYLNERLWPYLVKFSRRTGPQIQNWAKRYLTEDELATSLPVYTLEKARDYGDRYRALNIQPRNTVEFRLWRGTLNPMTFWATLQLVDNMVRVACDTPIDRLTTVGFEDIIGRQMTPDLEGYLKLRFPGAYSRIAVETMNDVGDDDVNGTQDVVVPQMEGGSECA